MDDAEVDLGIGEQCVKLHGRCMHIVQIGFQLIAEEQEGTCFVQ